MSARDRASAIGYATHNPVRPNMLGMIKRHGIKKMMLRLDATTRDGSPLPIPWKKKLRLFWTPTAKKPKAKMRRAGVPAAKKMGSVPNSDMI